MNKEILGDKDAISAVEQIIPFQHGRLSLEKRWDRLEEGAKILKKQLDQLEEGVKILKKQNDQLKERIKIFTLKKDRPLISER